MNIYIYICIYIHICIHIYIIYIHICIYMYIDNLVNESYILRYVENTVQL